MRRAFTLIELLVVIAIIAILAAILFPVFAQARMMAKKTASLSNMKQVSLAAMMYMGDYDDHTPARYYQFSNNPMLPGTRGISYWANVLMPYTKNERIFICPNDTADDPSLNDTRGRGRFDRQNEWSLYILGANPSYGFNFTYLNARVEARDPNGQNPRPFYYVGQSMSQIEQPSSTVMFAEATMKDLTPPGGQPLRSTIGYERIDPPSMWNTQVRFPDARSQGQLWGRFNPNQVVVAWADGSAKVRAIRSLAGPNTNRETLDRLWNGRGE